MEVIVRQCCNCKHLVWHELCDRGYCKLQDLWVVRTSLACNKWLDKDVF